MKGFSRFVSHSVEANAGTIRYPIRREMIFLITSSALLVNWPARAGIFEGTTEDDYQNDTSSLANLAKEVSTLEKNSEGKEERVGYLKTAINKWVAKYRRESRFSGRASYSSMYSAVNALSGHFNSFGPTSPVPKKRLDRVLQEIDQSLLLLSRGR